MGVLITKSITEDDGFIEEILPEGWYDVMVVKSEQRTIPSGKGYLCLTLHVMSGKFKGTTKRLAFWIYKGNSERAVNYGRAMLWRITKAVGIQKLTDTAQIENKMFRIKFGERVWDEKDQNTMEGFAPYIESESSHDTAEESKAVSVAKDHSQESPNTTPSVSDNEVEEASDDEVPF